MIIGSPKEIKHHECRVGLAPESVADLSAAGQKVLIGIGADDDQYQAAGAEIVESAGIVLERTDMIVKVSEPQGVERKKLRAEQILYTYPHLHQIRSKRAIWSTQAPCASHMKPSRMISAAYHC